LKFKPLRKVNIWETEMNLDAAYSMFKAFKMEERTESFDD
jgi:hypothetical protein